MPHIYGPSRHDSVMAINPREIRLEITRAFHFSGFSIYPFPSRNLVPVTDMKNALFNIHLRFCSTAFASPSHNSRSIHSSFEASSIVSYCFNIFWFFTSTIVLSSIVITSKASAPAKKTGTLNKMVQVLFFLCADWKRPEVSFFVKDKSLDRIPASFDSTSWRLPKEHQTTNHLRRTSPLSVRRSVLWKSKPHCPDR